MIEGMIEPAVYADPMPVSLAHSALRSIMCSVLVLFFLTNKTGGEDAGPWEGLPFPTDESRGGKPNLNLGPSRLTLALREQA